MFAGKSSELLRRVSLYESQGLTVAVVKSNIDNRYATDHVVTHDGTKKPCYAVPSLTEFREVHSSVYTTADVIAIDEAQFFPDLKMFCSIAADQDTKRVVLAGLDGDFMRRKFGQVLDVVPMADSVTKLTSICRFCEEEHAHLDDDGGGDDSAHDGTSSHSNNNNSNNNKHFPAVFSLRINRDRQQGEEGKQEVVGGAETYAPVCRRHYIELTTSTT